jgi:hypothetical protein
MQVVRDLQAQAEESAQDRVREEERFDAKRTTRTSPTHGTAVCVPNDESTDGRAK